MSNIPADLKYTQDDEWIRIEDDVAIVGITDHAQDALSDIVYLELPNEGDFFGVGETFGVVESVKAAADLLMAISGDVIEVNEDLIDTPELINSDPYGEAWMIKVKMSHPAEVDDLMDADAYEKYLSERE
ncbi:glycine cleavage system protein GcvH [Candidatus Leptofilum sp.]|uniref:glycine cleavage system protein GcvH n=1 Tax=Candidatus Leptofilum sp. TaxID=3241576 RepID=UPI003B59099F